MKTLITAICLGIAGTAIAVPLEIIRTTILIDFFHIEVSR